MQLSHFALTWEFGGWVSWVEVALSADGDRRARLALTHTAHLSEHWTEYGPGAAGVGWELGLLGLPLHLADPDAPKPDAAAFAASPDGKALIRGRSDGWRQAAVAAGEEPDAPRGSGAHRGVLHGRPPARLNETTGVRSGTSVTAPIPRTVAPANPPTSFLASPIPA